MHREAPAELHFAGGVDEKYFAGKAIVFHNEDQNAALGRAVIIGTAFSEEAKRVTHRSRHPRRRDLRHVGSPRRPLHQEAFRQPRL